MMELGMTAREETIHDCTEEEVVRCGEGGGGGVVTWAIQDTSGWPLRTPYPIIVFSRRWLIIDHILVTFGQT